MAKSKETFNKKEKEKKKRQKKQEKAANREERKSNSMKGASLEDMMAYVDENGNLTSAPPDIKNRKSIAAEDIPLGVARRIEEEEDNSPKVHTGLVTYFNASKGYGFIRDVDSKNSVFVHVKSLTFDIKEGDRLTFSIEKGARGDQAYNINKA